jgi:hypothetical protein
MGLTHCDDGMEHAWSPGTIAAGRRLHPVNRVEAPSRGDRRELDTTVVKD